MECRAKQRVEKEQQSGGKPGTAAAREEWVAQSNARAQPLVECIARFEPEWSSRFGDSSSDPEVCRWQPGVAEDEAAAWHDARAQLEQQRTLESQPEPRLDLDISIDFASKRCKCLELEATQLLPDLNLARQIFLGLRWALRDPADTLRAWLEPGLHTGQLNRHQAAHILCHDVGLSPETTRLEIERYTLDVPGQAPSYFAGATRLAELRAEMELLEGVGFGRKTYHDTLLAQGFMPIEFLGQRMRAAAPGPAEMLLAA